VVRQWPIDGFTLAQTYQCGADWRQDGHVVAVFPHVIGIDEHDGGFNPGVNIKKHDLRIHPDNVDRQRVVRDHERGIEFVEQ
jgi:hypothetical protein